MAIGMASFTMNDAITKAVSSEMNFGQVMLVRGLFAMLLMAALFLRRPKVPTLNAAMLTSVALRVAAEVAGTIFLYNSTDPNLESPPPINLPKQLTDAEYSSFLCYAEWKADSLL